MTIEYKLHTEMEITGELYFRLRQLGFSVSLEVCVPSSVHRSGMMRVDIACFKNKEIFAVVECKKAGKSVAVDGRQYRAYLELIDHGIAVVFVNSERSMLEAVRVLQRRRNAYEGI